jgi:hypothetical protein
MRKFNKRTDDWLIATATFCSIPKTSCRSTGRPRLTEALATDESPKRASCPIVW